ncbi:3-oxoacyl-ACP reductase FabG [Candidatus Accumulibacter sp. ACC003]|uniref:3-oxoacyl-ACP reductase FabG n=1 Tax=Candidatus Accumulibacter sp. ACC003 TaxID=2823334 RepID=UPI0025B7F4ED|nr:3-oxoacyl-ACP reductase FabG [Candidatus Accumulibacter sp. ACC003]
MTLDGEVALVTGASRGIGQAIALELASLGATVIGTATTSEGAARITAALVEAGRKGEGAVLEVRDATQVDALLRHIEKSYGAVSVLVNNAGITRDNLALRLKEEEWEAVIDTNLKAVFRLCKAVMRGMMKARRGRIINVTSVLGHAGNPGQANYCAAKAGVAGMSRALARELGSRNITVNCVAPGLIDTDMTKALDDQQKAVLLGSIPLGRLGSPQDVAAAVSFLASAGGAYITGTTIHVNGGMFVG